MTLALSDRSAFEHPQIDDARRRLNSFPHTVNILEDHKDNERTYRFITAEDTILLCITRDNRDANWPDPRTTLHHAANVGSFELKESEHRRPNDVELYCRSGQEEYRILLWPHPKSVTPAALRWRISEPIEHWILANPF